MFAVLGEKASPRLVEISSFEHDDEDGACGEEDDFKLKKRGATYRRK